MTVAFCALRAVFTAAFHKMDQLFAFDLVDHIGLNGRAVNSWRANRVANHKNLVELDFFTSIGRNPFNPKHIA